MKLFEKQHGIAVPMDRSNVDTDSIIPKQYLKSVERVGFGANLFDSWRYMDVGELGKDHTKRTPNPNFVFNQDRYKNASILLARENFGCGSSREHAVWALYDYGIAVVIATSYSDIFYNNAMKNGLLAVRLEAEAMEILFQRCYAQQGYELTVDLQQQSVSDGAAEWEFEINTFDKKRLLEGLDEIALTLQHADEIRAYEEHRGKDVPWLFSETSQ